MKEASKEISELRATLIALEKPRADAEILHLETMRELTKVTNSKSVSATLELYD